MQKQTKKIVNSGFTLIEILVVIGMIALLAAIVIVAINPARQFAQGRNTQRVSNVNAILNAIGQRMADNKGVFEGKFTEGGHDYYCPPLPSTSTSTIDMTTILTATTTTPSGQIGCLVPTYISTALSDPQPGTRGDYYVGQNANRVIVTAPAAELGQVISIER